MAGRTMNRSVRWLFKQQGPSECGLSINQDTVILCEEENEKMEEINWKESVGARWSHSAESR